MSKRIKSILALVLSLLLVCSIAVSVFADNGKTIRNVNEAYALVHGTDLIDIYTAKLYVGGKDAKDVYYVVCRGLDFTELDMSQPRSLANAIKIGLSNENNSYVRTLVSTVNTYVPAGAKLVFVGHSMGGMVIEQAIANSQLKAKYEILYSMSIGSPYILTKGSKEGYLVRIVDRLDPVPFLSIPLLANPLIGNVDLETSFKAPLVHFKSYEQGSCWRSYDALGVKGGGSYIVLGEQLCSLVA